VLSQHFKGGNKCAHWILPGPEFSFLPSIPPLDSFASWQGVNREKDERRRGLAGQDYGRIGILPPRRASHFIQIFLGNIILRYLMRANFPLISGHQSNYLNLLKL
jgi:hypothetical protein